MNYLVKNGDEVLRLHVVTGAPQVPGGMELMGPEEDYPEIVAQLQSTKIKNLALSSLYNNMNSEVLAQMAAVFGTSNADSANANKQTWELMKAKPSLFVPSKFATEVEVVSFAEAKISAVETYAVWREQRIDQFRLDKNNLLNS